ncbi:hypothetical protein LTR05_003102 [Lithohypha guttulata]|uniref:Uncharacterized protein n=1 Tax=Lithohypha guttulata TaxID=1690604 RepID=A0AAN7T406_9EURO|nr:hypothetical protein LTR05_003102 [Lithohypha guttulata]
MESAGLRRRSKGPAKSPAKRGSVAPEAPQTPRETQELAQMEDDPEHILRSPRRSKTPARRKSLAKAATTTTSDVIDTPVLAAVIPELLPGRRSASVAHGVEGDYRGEGRSQGAMAAASTEPAVRNIDPNEVLPSIEEEDELFLQRSAPEGRAGGSPAVSTGQADARRDSRGLSSSPSIGKTPSPAPRDTPRYSPTHNPRQIPTQDAAQDPQKTFRQLFEDECRRGLRHLGRRWWLLPVAISMFWGAVCSAGPICHNHGYMKVLRLQCMAAPSESFCLIAVYFLLLSSISDIFLGIVRVLVQIGTRGAVREDQPQVVEPADYNLRALLRSVRDWTTHFFRHFGWKQFFRNYIWSIVCDFMVHVLEPIVILVGSLGLRWRWGGLLDGQQALSAFVMVYVTKWFLQAIENYSPQKPWLAHLDRGRLFWTRRPLVVLFLAILSAIFFYQHWDTTVDLVNTTWHAVRVAKAYGRSSGGGGHGNVLKVGGSRIRSTSTVVSYAYVVTQALVRTILPTVTGR